MILTKLDYHQNKEKKDYWKIEGVNFGMFNLVVGLNATGKTRLINIINNLAKMISKKIPIKNGVWNLEFEREGDKKYLYKLKIEEGKILYEEIKIGTKTYLTRNKGKGEIYSATQKKLITINPPISEFTLHIRRDIKEFPFFEELFNWADNLLGYNFTGARPDEVVVPNIHNKNVMLEDLGATSYLLHKLSKKQKVIDSIMNDFSSIGYPINKISTKSARSSLVPNTALISTVKEEGLLCETMQTQMSQGMFRALALVIILHYLLEVRKETTVLIDDLGEGLDFKRSSELIKLCIKKIKNSKIQLIISSNDRFLINTVDVKHINVLERSGHVVKAANYSNTKKLFDEFKFTGLNNFDLFSGKMYKSQN